MTCDPVDRCECSFYERTTDWVVYWCENNATHEAGGQVSTKDETAARIREFLALSDEVPDDEQMWIVGGLELTWGDLRVLADYKGGGKEG
jgi:hypothetical protein